MKPTAPPDPNPRQPKFRPPPLACDAHCHVFGPVSVRARRAVPGIDLYNMRESLAKAGLRYID